MFKPQITCGTSTAIINLSLGALLDMATLMVLAGPLFTFNVVSTIENSQSWNIIRTPLVEYVSPKMIRRDHGMENVEVAKYMVYQRVLNRESFIAEVAFTMNELKAYWLN